MKAISARLLAVLILLGGAGCSGNKEQSPGESKNNSAAATIAAAKPVFAAGAVYTVDSFQPRPSDDQIADFSWSENGRTVWLSDICRDNVVLLNFWGTWAPPCRKEIPDISDIARERPDVVVIGVALEKANVKDPVRLVSRFVDKHAIPYLTLAGKRNTMMGISAEYGIASVPTSFIIRKGGSIAEELKGAHSKDQFLTALDKAGS